MYTPPTPSRPGLPQRIGVSRSVDARVELGKAVLDLMPTSESVMRLPALVSFAALALCFAPGCIPNDDAQDPSSQQGQQQPNGMQNPQGQMGQMGQPQPQMGQPGSNGPDAAALQQRRRLHAAGRAGAAWAIHSAAGRTATGAGRGGRRGDTGRSGDGRRGDAAAAGHGRDAGARDAGRRRRVRRPVPRGSDPRAADQPSSRTSATRSSPRASA